MSDIVIRNWKMWESCDDCPIYIDCELCQHIDGYKMLDGRPNNCPVIVLPDGHGDLIDKDEAMNAILDEPTDEHYQTMRMYCTPSWFADVVNEVSAVVPAEKGK